MIAVVPRLFWDDHFDRCADHPGLRKVIKSGVRRVTVELDAIALEDLVSDARHYAHDGLDGPDLRSLCRSAAATLRAIT